MTVVASLAAGAGIILAGVVPSMASNPDSAVHPVVLEAVQDGDRLTIAVIGESAEAVSARYSLEADSGKPNGGNRSTQSGNVSLQPHQRKVLINLTLGNVTGAAWKARLAVTVDGGQSYVIERSAGQ